MFRQKKIPLEISETEIRKYLDDILNRKEAYARRIVITQYCKTNGIVTHDGSLTDNYCSDPTCFNCNQFHELLAEEAKKFLV